MTQQFIMGRSGLTAREQLAGNKISFVGDNRLKRV
jgi:hypothetical protein